MKEVIYIKSYKELDVWNKSMELVVAVYQVTKLLPQYETYGISDQMRRSAVSIPSNIAEGNGRHSTRDYINFLTIARGSCYELETQLLICVQIGYVKESDIEDAINFCQEVGKMLSAMIGKLRTLINNRE